MQVWSRVRDEEAGQGNQCQEAAQLAKVRSPLPSLPSSPRLTDRLTVYEVVRARAGVLVWAGADFERVDAGVGGRADVALAPARAEVPVRLGVVRHRVDGCSDSSSTTRRDQRQHGAT